MSIEEKLRSALRAHDQIDPAPDARQRLEARIHGRRAPRLAGHSVVVGLAAVLAVGAIAAVRLVSDRPSGVTVISPATGVPSTGPTTLLLSPSGSPSPSPSPSPTGDKVHYLSADGVWELWYPKDWFGPEEASGTFPASAVGFQNFRSDLDEVALPIKVSLSVYANKANLTFNELVAEVCKTMSAREVFECTKMAIGGVTWIVTRAYSTEEEATMWLRRITIIDSTIYDATGYVYGTSGHGPAIAQIQDVFDSIVLHT